GLIGPKVKRPKFRVQPAIRTTTDTTGIDAAPWIGRPLSSTTTPVMMYWRIGVGFGEGDGVGVGFVTPSVCERPEQPTMMAPVSKIRATPTSTCRHPTAFGSFAFRHVSFRNPSPSTLVWRFTSHLRGRGNIRRGRARSKFAVQE